MKRQSTLKKQSSLLGVGQINELQADLNQTLLTIERKYREVSLSDASQLQSENYYLKHKLRTFYSEYQQAINVCNDV